MQLCLVRLCRDMLLLCFERVRPGTTVPDPPILRVGGGLKENCENGVGFGLGSCLSTEMNGAGSSTAAVEQFDFQVRGSDASQCFSTVVLMQELSARLLQAVSQTEKCHLSACQFSIYLLKPLLGKHESVFIHQTEELATGEPPPPPLQKKGKKGKTPI